MIEKKWNLLTGIHGFGVNKIITAKVLSETETDRERQN